MNVDAQFPPAAFAGTTHRPAQGPSEQTTSRPVDRPHHDEATGKQSRHDSEQVAGRKPADQNAAAEISKQEDNRSSATETAPARGGFDTNPTQPASVGELLDVLA
jgi:hypothetical protein